VTGDRGPARVLVVCTGNVCRSPAAELLLRAGLPDGAGIAVHSAGVAARVGEPVAEPTARLLRARGVDPEGFAARQLTPVLLREADLVLTMTAEQRTGVVRRVPAVLRRTFTLREFADLATLAGPGAGPGRAAERLADLVRAAPRGRSARAAGPEHDDVADPYRRPDDAHARALGRIEDAAGRLLAALLDRPV
jgi:low molecular weight protein-tyrosine phosphatase